MTPLAPFASSTYQAITGFSVPMLMEWATSSVLKLYVGTALSFIDNLRFWVIAAFVIGAILYFASIAMHFFRH